MRDQVQDDQVANQNIYPSGLVTETQPRFDIDTESSQNQAQEVNPSDSTRASTRINLTIAMSGAQNYFGRSTKRTEREVLKRRVICAKGDCGKAGSRECDNHHTVATAALLYKFGAARHFEPRNSEGGTNYSYKYLAFHLKNQYPRYKLVQTKILLLHPNL